MVFGAQLDDHHTLSRGIPITSLVGGTLSSCETLHMSPLDTQARHLRGFTLHAST